jgi:hypothetical protein
VKNRDCGSVEGLLSFILMRHFNVTTVTDNLCQFSPNWDKVVYCVENKLTVRNMRTFDQCHTYCCVDVITVSYCCCIYQ